MVIQTSSAKPCDPQGKDAPSWIARAFSGPITLCLVLADAALIILHGCLGLLHMESGAAGIPDFLRIDRDWSLGEMLNYAKWLVLAGLSALIFCRQRQVVFLAVMILSMVALLDDSLQLHERFGSLADRALDLDRYLPRGAGEIIFMAIEGMAVAVALVYGWTKATSSVRRQIVPLLLLLSGAAFCASAIDFLHVHAPANSITAGILGIFEDGGEMVFLSLAVGYAAGLTRQSRAAAFA